MQGLGLVAASKIRAAEKLDGHDPRMRAILQSDARHRGKSWNPHRRIGPRRITRRNRGICGTIRRGIRSTPGYHPAHRPPGAVPYQRRSDSGLAKSVRRQLDRPARGNQGTVSESPRNSISVSIPAARPAMSRSRSRDTWPHVPRSTSTALSRIWPGRCSPLPNSDSTIDRDGRRAFLQTSPEPRGESTHALLICMWSNRTTKSPGGRSWERPRPCTRSVWPPVFRAMSAAGRSPTDLGAASDKSCLVWLAGGASRLETWDPRSPETDTGGPFRSIETSVPGVRISGVHSRLTARQMHHIAIVRGVNTKEDDHGKGYYFMHTGRRQAAGAGVSSSGLSGRPLPDFRAVIRSQAMSISSLAGGRSPAGARPLS